MWGLPLDLSIQMAASLLIASVKNPESWAKWQSLLFKIAAVIYAAAASRGLDGKLDMKIDEEITKLASSKP